MEILVMSVPVLNICEWQPSLKTNDTRTIQTVRFQETKRLVSCLDRMVLPSPPLLPDDMPTIKKFRLDYRGPDRLFNSRIYGWISSLVLRKFEELSLCLQRDFLLPPCLFTCETLTVLEIEMAGNLSSKSKKTGNLGFPPTVSFSRLKILRLTHIVFVDADLTTQLFSNCPVLEELMLNKCCMVEMKVSCVSVASLKRLFITSPARNSWNLKINLFLPNLQSLTYTGMPEDFILTGHGFSSLVDADIDMPFESMNIYTKRGKERLRGLKNLAEGILNVKLLKISGDPIVYLYFEDVLAECTFQNLRQLEVSSKLSCGTTKGLFYLLFKVPNLESIIFSQGFTEFLLNATPYNEVPKCLLLQLKAVEFREIDGHGVELDVITFFLKNSLVLQTMTITFSSSLPQCWRDIVIRTLLMSPKGAANGVINFL